MGANSSSKSVAAQVMATASLLSEQQLSTLAGWGGGCQLSATEALMWRMEGFPSGSSAGTSLHFLASTPAWEDVSDFVDGLSKAVPRLRQCVHELPGVAQLPEWRDDAHFQLRNHLHRMSLPKNSDTAALLSAVTDFANTPINVDCPPWEVLFVEGLKDGKSVFALKIQHSLTDGGGLIQLFTAALSDSSNTQLRGSEVAAMMSVAPTPAKRGIIAKPLKLMASTLKVWQHRHDENYSLASAQKYLQSIQALNAAQGRKGSRLLQRRSASNGYDLLSLDLARIKLLAKAAQASVNDIYLALIIGAFQRYHAAFGVEDELCLPLAFPVSLRKASDAVGGNQFTGVSYAAPLNIADPQARIKLIQDFVRRARAEPALDFMNQLLPVAMVLPIKLTAKLIAQYTARLDVQVSNIPGMSRRAYLAGALVESHYVLPPRPGCAGMFAMISHQNVAGIALNYDPAAIREPKLLLSCVSDEFAALCAHFSINEVV